MSHAIAATFGYEDGENIPLDLHLSMVERITRTVDLPVTMDMEAGYGDAGETTLRAIAAGVASTHIGLTTAAEVYGVAVIVLALSAVVGLRVHQRGAPARELVTAD